MPRKRVPTHVWLKCDNCGMAVLVKRTGPKMSKRCYVCPAGKLRTPVLCPYPELGELGKSFVEPSVLEVLAAAS